MNKNDFEELEKNYKEVIFQLIRKCGTSQSEIIDSVTKKANNIGQSNVDIPNTCITVNNKMVELSQIFKKAGISMFATQLNDYDVVTTSFLGDSIIQDLMVELNLSIEKLNEYRNITKMIFDKKNQKRQTLQNVSPLKKLFKTFFVPTKPEDTSLTDEEQHMLNRPLQEYIDINSKILDYNLEEDLVPALVKGIASQQTIRGLDLGHHYAAAAIPKMLEECVIPDLKKLGLESLIPKLQEALIEEYKKDLPDSKFYKVKDEDMHLYVPDFSKKNQKSQAANQSEKTLDDDDGR